jgi:hypothetical protein
VLDAQIETEVVSPDRRGHIRLDAVQCPQVADKFEDWFTSWRRVSNGVSSVDTPEIVAGGRPARYQRGDTLSPFVRASLLGDPLLAYRACIDRALGACFQPHTSAPSNESRTKDCRKPLEHLLDSF